MEKKTLISKIKALFNEETQEESVEFVDVETQDGQILRVADVAVDQPVEIVEGENLVEAPDGNYVLVDGTTLVVSGGMITEIQEAEEAPAEEEEMSEETEAKKEEESKEEESKEEMEEESKETDLDNAILNALETLTNEVASLKEGFNKVEAENKELKEKVEAFGKLPSEEHTETKKEFKTEKKKSKSPLHAIKGY